MQDLYTLIFITFQKYIGVKGVCGYLKVSFLDYRSGRLNVFVILTRTTDNLTGENIKSTY